MVPAHPESQRLAAEDRRAALATSGSTRFTRMSTPYHYTLRRSEIARGHSRSGATIHSDYATTMTTMMITRLSWKTAVERVSCPINSQLSRGTADLCSTQGGI